MPPYKVRNRNTGEIIEFDFEGTPSQMDIDRIINERRAPSNPSRNQFSEPVKPQAPTFRNQFGRLADFATTSLFPDAERDIGEFAGRTLGNWAKGPAEFITGGATSPLGLASGVIGGGVLTKLASKLRSTKQPLTNVAGAVTAPANITKPKYRMLLDDAGKNIGYEPISDIARPMQNTFSPLGEFQELSVPAMKASGSGTPVITDATKIIRARRRTSGFGMGQNVGMGTDLPPIKPPITQQLEEFKPELPKIDIRKGSKLTEAINFPKSTWASLDLSAPLRQGKGLIHKKEFWTSLKPMMDSLVSEDSFVATQNAIKAKPTYKAQVDSGLALGDLSDITKREEQIMSSWAEKIPGIRASNRAYTTFLNKLRSDTFDSLVSNAQKGGMDVNEKDIAKFINNTTGRGSLGSWENKAVALNNVFFSPRYISSRLNMLASPVTYMNASPQVKKEVVKSLIATTGYWATGAGLANVAGADINMDPTNSDFGKIKVGDTRIDTLAGYQQYIRTAYQILSGEKTSPITGKTKQLGEGYKADTRKDVLEQFGRSKAAPVAGLVYDTLRGRTLSGRPIGPEMSRKDTENYFYKMLVPNMIQTAKDLYKEDPSLFSGFAGAAALFGEGVQVFDDYSPLARRNRYLSR